MVDKPLTARQSIFGTLVATDCTPKVVPWSRVLLDLILDVTGGGPELEAALLLGAECVLHVRPIESSSRFSDVSHVCLEVPGYTQLDFGEVHGSRLVRLLEACGDLGWRTRMEWRNDHDR